MVTKGQVMKCQGICSYRADIIRPMLRLLLWCIDVIKRSKVTEVKVKGQGSKVKVSINVKEKAGGLTPTSNYS